MGPRPFGRGNENFPLQICRDNALFNGAAAFRSRKWRRRVAGLPSHRPFNGAAAFRSRKYHDPNFVLGRTKNLQWGRWPFGRGNADRPGRCPGGGDPSMGPRPFGRGNDLFRMAGGNEFRPSMGPRPFGRGNNPLGKPCNRQTSALQWGRGLSVAEITAYSSFFSAANALQWGRRPFGRGNYWPDTTGTVQEVPSMGPRPFGRGNMKAAFNRFAQACPSMGPRPFGRGNWSGRWLKPSRWGRLQWGRRPFGRGNDGSSRSPHIEIVLLQWGRGLSVAEIASRRNGTARRFSPFNGAAAFRSRKSLPGWLDGLADPAPSMGPRPFGRGNHE